MLFKIMLEVKHGRMRVDGDPRQHSPDMSDVYCFSGAMNYDVNC